MNKPAFPKQQDPYAALKFQDFRLLVAGRFMTTFGDQLVSFAIGWELWLRTHDELALGLVGLVQVVPIILLSLPAGHLADQGNRKKIVILSQAVLAMLALGLAMISYSQGSLFLIYLCLFGIGIARAFNTPATTTLLPQTVPEGSFTNAATWSSSAWQFASIVGPAVAGLLVALTNTVWFIYLCNTAAGLIFIVLVAFIKGKRISIPQRASSLESIKEGVGFIYRTKVIFAAITLDMFAVLLGGAVTLLPVFATDILKVGSIGLGIMRAAPSIGAITMAFILTHLPPFKHTGVTLLLAVAGFGLATILFGLSTIFWLSVLMLFLLGALDNISVIIRNTLVLVRTPDEMRGRISAVNSIFIGASNELGGFESGITAAWWGPVVSVVGGGIGTILVVLAVARLWPEMRRLRTLEQPAGSDMP